MFYHWLAPLGKTYIIFNLFNYISFRAAGATVTALLLAFLVGPPVIARLRARKVGQIIRAEGPASHQSKRGTPTMGGLIIILSTVVPTLLWAPLTNRFVVVAMLAILWMGCIGFLDDYLKIVQGKSRGLVARWKLAGQVSFGLLLGLFLVYFPVVPRDTIPATATSLPFFKYLAVNFAPWLYVVFVTTVITGSSNAVNLTDGLDSLAGGTAAVAFVAYGIIAFLQGQIQVVTFCFTMAGALLGFLWYNAHPAQVFMGDTGSLAVGAALATAAFMTGQWLLLPVVGIVFMAETISVMMQVAYFKLTHGKRFFLMSPLHNHFVLKGWSETQITLRLWLVGMMAGLLGVALALI